MLGLSSRRSSVRFALALCWPAGFAFAQSGVAPPVATLGEIVVSASGFEQDLQRAPASISVIDGETLRTRQYRDLAEALREVEGVDVLGGTGKTGGLDISIRGMPSDYTLVLIDGRRQNVSGNVTPNGFNSALNSFMPPLSEIERIEIIRGPMSTLYGSDAIGGVVNIITRAVRSEWGGSLGVSAALPQEKKEGVEHRTTFSLGGPLLSDRLNLSLRGEVFRREASERIWRAGGNARDPRPAASRQYSAGARLTWQPLTTQRFWLDVSQGRTWYDNRDCRLGGRDYLDRDCATPSEMVSGYQDYMRLNRDQLVLAHDARWGDSEWTSSLSRSRTSTVGRTIPSASRPRGHQDIGRERLLRDDSWTFDSKWVTSLGASHRATLGGQWQRASFQDGLLPTRFQSRMWALFAEDEWRLAPTLTATLGTRYTRHRVYGGELTPRAYLVWAPSPEWTVKGGIGRGFRAPRLDQLTDGVSGISGQGRNINIGNPNLKPEISTNTELGLAYDNQRGLTMAMTLFQNRIRDRITSGAGDCAVDWISSCAANPRATYARNLDSAKTWGLELRNTLPLASALLLDWNYTWTGSEVIEQGQRNGPLSDTPRHRANARLRWDLSERLELWLRAEYRGKSARFVGDPARLRGANLREYQAVGDLRGYTLFHLGGAYRFSERLSFSASVNNLFNKDFTAFRTWTDFDEAGQPYQTYSSPYFGAGASIRGTALPGRTFWLSANMSF